MPGHDKSRIVGHRPSHLDEFTCGICHDVLNDPVVTQCCRTSFCRDCIEDWLTGHKTCPNDRKPLTSDGLLEAPRLVVNVIRNMKIHCEHTEKGCPSVVTTDQLGEHLQQCQFSKCHDCGATDAGPGHDCLAYLIQENAKLKSNASLVEFENKNLKSELSKVKMELDFHGKQMSSMTVDMERRVKTIECQYNIVWAVDQAKHQLDDFVIKISKSVPPETLVVFVRLCKETIAQFSKDKHTATNFVEQLSKRVEQTPKRLRLNKIWLLDVFIETSGVCDYHRDNYCLRIDFGNLIIVIRTL